MDEEIRYSDHLLYRLRVRRFDANLPKTIIESSEEILIDKTTGNSVAIGQATYAGKVRELAVAFIDKSEYIEVITIHPLKPGQKAKRISTGRWVAK